MKKRSVIISLFLLVVGIIGFSGYYYIMHGGERDLLSEDADFTVSSKDIAAEFTTNVESSNKKYLEKAVAVTGTITDASPTEITIDNAIICNLKNPDSSIKKDQKVTVKGRVVGYDDLMEELKLDQCFLTKI